MADSSCSGSNYSLTSWRVVILVCATLVIFCFPPWRERAEWRNVDTGDVPNIVDANRNDRFLFGYFPRCFGWIGSKPEIRKDSFFDPETMTPGASLTTITSVTYEYEQTHLAIDWDVISMEFVLIWSIWLFLIGGKGPLTKPVMYMTLALLLKSFTCCL